MTTLTDPQIADVCRHAGMVGPHLVTGIATVLAASGGIPSYDHAVWPGPTAHYTGLWGLDTVEWPHTADRTLTNPYVAARTAQELTRAHGWAWCPVWRAGSDRWYEARARAAAGRLPAIETQTDPIGLATYRRHGDQAAHATGQLIDAITRTHPGG